MKDQECIDCKHVFKCPGKPEGVTGCINKENRKENRDYDKGSIK